MEVLLPSYNKDAFSDLYMITKPCCESMRFLSTNKSFICKSWTSHIYRSHESVWHVNVYHDSCPIWFIIYTISLQLASVRDDVQLHERFLERGAWLWSNHDLIRPLDHHTTLANLQFTRLPIVYFLNLTATCLFDYIHANRLIKVESWKLIKTGKLVFKDKGLHKALSCNISTWISQIYFVPKQSMDWSHLADFITSLSWLVSCHWFRSPFHFISYFQH